MKKEQSYYNEADKGLEIDWKVGFTSVAESEGGCSFTPTGNPIVQSFRQLQSVVWKGTSPALAGREIDVSHTDAATATSVTNDQQ